MSKAFQKILARSRQMQLGKLGALRLLCRYRRTTGQQRYLPVVGIYPPTLTMSATVVSLVHRLDRRAILKQHLEIMKVDFDFFDACADTVPAAGCAESHASVLSNWDTSKANWLMILEDDIEFHIDRIELSKIIEDFLNNPSLDVLCLAHNTFGKTVTVSKHLSISQHSQTTAAYVIKARARETLVRTFLESSTQIRKGKPANKFAMDMLWTRNQRRDLIFAIPRKKVATQRASYSDIEKSFVDYGV